MDKRPIGYVPGKGNPLDKKVPKSQKYEHVEKTLDTGLTVKNVEVISNNNIAKRKGELFKRIKTSTIANLLKQEKNIESIYNLNQNETNQALSNINNVKKYAQDDNMSVRSQFTEVSKISAVTYATQQLGINDETTFLLLDLRDPEEYGLFHLKEAVNFPAPYLARDKILPELYRFKNKEGKLIIIYEFDEKKGIPSAQLFAEKGYDNVYLVSGGIEKFIQDYPELVEGKRVPVIAKPKEQTKVIKRSNYREGEADPNFNVKSNIDGQSIKDVDSISQVSKVSKKTAKK